MEQILENLPDEILRQPRFIRTKEKIPVVKEWQDPKNQHFYDNVKVGLGYFAGLDICGHGIGHDIRPDILVLDFDHVFDEKGNFVNDTAQKWYNLAAQSGTYCEKSISGCGLHFFFLPRPGAFYSMASGTSARLDLGDGACVEIFYMPGGRYFLVTGNVYNCTPKTPFSTDCDCIYIFLDEIRKLHPSPTRQTKSKFYSSINLAELQKALDNIPFLDYPEWIQVGMALYNDLGDNDDAFNLWRDFSALDSRRGSDGKPQFNEKKMRYFWEHFNPNLPDEEKLHVGTIFWIAKRYGYQPPTPKNDVDAAKGIVEDLVNNGLPKDKINTPETIHACAVLKVYSTADWNNFYERLKGVVNRNNFIKAVNKESKPILNNFRDECNRKKRDEYQAIAAEQFKQLEELKLQPPTPDRDNELIALINDLAEWKLDFFSNERLHIKATAKNARLFFDNDPLLDGLFGYDEFCRYPVFLKVPYWKKGGSVGDKVENDDDAHIRLYLRDNYGEFSNDSLVADCITVYAHMQSFNPVKKYLEGLKWDGTPRAETFFIDFLDVADTPYSRQISINWLMGAIARLYYPGCEYQSALVLQGVQGIGKSYVTEMLGGKWHIKLTDSLDDSHAIDAIKSAWIAEIEEWTAGRKADINAAKSFISRGYDTRRGAYERREEKTARHCVFVVTVNDSQFLRDHTGNRRFLILMCRSAPNQIKKNLSEEYINQVWAEVLVKFNELMVDGFNIAKLRLPNEIIEQAEITADSFLLDDGLATEITAFLEKPIPALPIWLMMTKDERRKFFVDGSIYLYLDDLHHRFQVLPDKWRNDPQIQKEFDGVLHDAKAVLDKDNPDTAPQTNGFALRFYGKFLRQHVCAAEIYTECFGQDRRKSMTRINEVLDNLEGWTQSGRLRNADTQYSDMKKVYCRDRDDFDF